MSLSSDSKCGKCGFCLAVCPVHKVLNEEQASPRAKVQLVKAHDEGKLPSSSYLKELISKCLMCGSCTANCPSGVDHYSTFMEMRRQMVESHGERVEIRGLIYLLAREQRLKLAASVARLGQKTLPNGFQKKFEVANIPIASYPQLNKRPFRMKGRWTVQSSREKSKVLYFTGCATNYIFGSTGHATQKILQSIGHQVIIPEDQCCCAIPMLFHGAVNQAKDNILQNLQSFYQEDIEAIIVDCPTCGSALKEEYPRLVKRLELNAEAASWIASKTTDLMSFLADKLNQLEFKPQHEAGEPIRVTYHAPCHLKNRVQQTDRVLHRLPGVQYLQAEDMLECCGGGGTFFYEHPEVAEKIAEEKVINARRTGTQVWLTDCPVCRINLSGRLAADDPIILMHPIEFISTLIG